jgi:hypothetical protein
MKLGTLASSLFVLAQAFASTGNTGPLTETLPAHFGIGLQNAPLEVTWMTGSGVPWDYRYQYINPGWKSWNTPAGQFAANYTTQSIASHYVPVFTWYVMGGTYPSNYANYLASTSFMYNYYADFTLLMQKIASVSTSTTPVIVHIEPDLWGVLQQWYWDDPTVIPASVASSGFAGLGALPNNAAGFAKALVKIRDTYAPHVILAWHASHWGANNGFDPPKTTFASWETPQVTGERIAAFYMALGAPFDMIFHDPSDADSAYKVIVRGEASNKAWWTDGAFTNYLQYISAVYQRTGLQSMLWQVPVGNTLYQSLNNSRHHYQDNRPQYFLGPGNRQNIVNYLEQGVIGLLIGRGHDATTYYMDMAGDGITNPSSICGNPFCSSGSTTFNTKVATAADDDGGFLRTAATAYYAAGPIAISGPNPPPTPKEFAIGATVRTAATTQCYQQRPFSRKYQTQSTGTAGTITEGPRYSKGRTWWFVRFSNASGWVAQDDLEAV